MLNAQEVRVAGAGHVFIAPEGTALPTDLGALDPAFVDLGYVTTDGVGFTFSRESDDLDSWQADKIRVLASREPATIGFSLMQTSADIMVVAMGGGTVSLASAGVYRYDPPIHTNLTRAMVVEFDDGGKKYRYCIPRIQVEGDVSYTLTRTGALTYPLTFGLLDASPSKYFILTDDDAAFGAGSLPGTIGGGAAVPVLIPTFTMGAADPVAAADDGSVYVNSTSLSVFIHKAGSWVDSTETLGTAPAAVFNGVADPTATAPAGTPSDDDVYFQDTGLAYETWILTLGTWVDASKTITK